MRLVNSFEIGEVVVISHCEELGEFVIDDIFNEDGEEFAWIVNTNNSDILCVPTYELVPIH